MSILLFLIVLFVLVLVHEWGHFIVAKKTGMRVDEFGIGFPPKVWGFKPKNGETEYTFNVLPIGGFVRIFGENGDIDDESMSPVASNASDRRSEAFAEAGEGGSKSLHPDAARAFGARPKWAQALVLIAGVTMNVLFAWLLFSITLMIGVPQAVEESHASASAELIVASVMEGSPADGTIPAGATIVGVSADDGPSGIDLTPSAFSDFVREQEGSAISVLYEFEGEIETVTLTPTLGLAEDDPERYLVGTALALVETKREPIHIAVINGFMTTVNGLISIAAGLSTLIVQSFTGTADYSQIAGPVGIVNLVGDAASFGIAALLTFTAVISLNLAVINLLPFPALDGGRLVFVAIEAVTGKQIPPVWAARVNIVGFALLMLLMVAVTYNDIVRLL